MGGQCRDMHAAGSANTSTRDLGHTCRHDSLPDPGQCLLPSCLACSIAVVRCAVRAVLRAADADSSLRATPQNPRRQHPRCRRLNPAAAKTHLHALLVDNLDVAADAGVLVDDAVLDNAVGPDAEWHAAVLEHLLALLFTLIVVSTNDQRVLYVCGFANETDAVGV